MQRHHEQWDGDARNVRISKYKSLAQVEGHPGDPARRRPARETVDPPRGAILLDSEGEVAPVVCVVELEDRMLYLFVRRGLTLDPADTGGEFAAVEANPLI